MGNKLNIILISQGYHTDKERIKYVVSVNVSKSRRVTAKRGTE